MIPKKSTTVGSAEVKNRSLRRSALPAGENSVPTMKL